METTTESKTNTTTTTTTTTKDIKENNNDIPIYIKFIGFWFFLFQLVVVICSWRVYFLFTDDYKKDSSNKSDKSKENNTNNDQPSTNNVTPPPPPTKSFKEKVQNNFFGLLTDSFYMIMILITCTLFFWRAKSLYTQIRKSDSTEWKSIIWDEFSSGGIEFSSFTVLLLLKWPVIFKVFWNKGTDKEDKSTWAQIFLREFSKDAEKKKESADSGSSGSASSSRSGGVGSDKARKTLSDDQWKKQFQMDLQNIGFEFGPTGEVVKFPPTEVMEQYQKSNRFRDLILQAGPSKPAAEEDVKIEDFIKAKQTIDQHNQEQQMQQQKPNDKKQKISNRKGKNKK
ncbi:hypothetical protein DICPUDRAFT_153478 [Dictyostelium purpureum]|uniref:Uncharacterized protein n=1 Tax=Dictyostelium purpureum TaxID=5786 RepID=F0ZP09_DICPU|nr:uncharacterized protein DICPUDRAFT_153478 [Dictyostelium purpureum]EGC34323.1 hypothetical protein DICPUDRAFT_153478 [Dictyostelium purpureum]|eukprot:XP_003289159.1 hypothetical protein DICPUDRAFT_153478 [Dictyostelium purpureum]